MKAQNSFGEGTVIYATLGQCNVFGNNVQIDAEHKDKSKITTEIGDNCSFGDNVSVKDFTTIGNNVKIGANVFIRDFVSIGNNVTIKANTRIFPAADICSDVIIGKNASIGEGCEILEGCKIPDNFFLKQAHCFP